MFLRLAAALAAAWALGGCSALQLAYENADFWLRWRAGSYLDVHGKAAEDLDARIDDFLLWHRAKALPAYARLSEEAARRVAAGAVSREDVVWGYDSFIGQARESLRAAAERIAPLLDGLSAEQIRHMEQRFAEDNRKFAKEFLRGSEAERRKRRAKRVVERLEDWVGELSQAQLERVAQYSARAPLYDELRERDRRRLQAEFLRIVRAREARKRLPERAAHWDAGRDPAYAAVVENARQAYLSLLLDLDRTLSAEQRAQLVAHFQRYARDFSVLAARAEPERRPAQ